MNRMKLLAALAVCVLVMLAFVMPATSATKTVMYVPTGTGLPHVVSGVQSSVSTTIVDADVNSSAAIGITKLAICGAGTVFHGGVANNSCSAVNLASDVTGALPIANGGTGTTSGGVTKVGTFASRPTPGTAGAQYITTDGPIRFVDDGAAWRPLIGGTLGTAPLAASNWTQINAGGNATTFADYMGGIRMSATNGTSGNDVRLVKKGQPSSPPWSMTAHFLPTMPTVVNLMGIGARNSSNGYLSILSYVWDTGNMHQVHHLTANNNGTSPTYSTSAATTVANGQLVYAINGFWFKIQNDGTNLNGWVSIDGLNFSYMFSETLASFIGTADEVVLHMLYSSSTSRPFSVIYDSIAFGN